VLQTQGSGQPPIWANGTPGPQGPQGATGATGATGPQGPAGVSNFPVTYTTADNQTFTAVRGSCYLNTYNNMTLNLSNLVDGDIIFIANFTGKSATLTGAKAYFNGAWTNTATVGVGLFFLLVATNATYGGHVVQYGRLS